MYSIQVEIGLQENKKKLKEEKQKSVTTLDDALEVRGFFLDRTFLVKQGKPHKKFFS